MLLVWRSLFCIIIMLLVLEIGDVMSCKGEEREALVSFQEGGVNGILSSWKASEDCCQWEGIGCNDISGQVQMIDLSLSSSQQPEGGIVGLKLDQLANLSGLQYLDLSYCDLGKAMDWVQIVSQLPSLEILSLDWCNLPSSSAAVVGINSSKLTYVSLSGNNLTSSAVYPWLFNLTHTHLAYLDLSSNHLQGPVPEAFGYITSLAYLNLDQNELQGGIPESFNNLCLLAELSMLANNLSGDLTTHFLQNLPDGCQERMSPMWRLELSRNQITGSTLDQVARFPSLLSLALGSNRLSGTISEAHFFDVPRLDYLDLSYNPDLFLNFSSDWSPKFKLVYLILGSCKLGPTFPTWLRSQRYLFGLDISAAGISDTIPNWFWDITEGLCFFNISHNQVTGDLPDLSSRFNGVCPSVGVDFSSNLLQGSLPLLPSNLGTVILADNTFSGSLSSICEIKNNYLVLLDLSNNLLSGKLPDCFTQWPSLKILSLANNKLIGPVPTSVGSLPSLQMLNLRSNSLSGQLPESFNFTRLTFLDLSNNAFSGIVPDQWLKTSSQSFVFLSLRANHFSGHIPGEICGLTKVRVLDLSLNGISGGIPGCISNLTAMTHNLNLTSEIKQDYVFISGGIIEQRFYSSNVQASRAYISKALLVWKGRERDYTRNLGYLALIDFSGNQLTGEIPAEISSLSQLLTLNLSSNSLHGTIPRVIGQLRQLEVLDLSNNRLSGNIPSTLSELTFLNQLNLSYNRLSGRIPESTQIDGFEASAFAGNLALCGHLIKVSCSRYDMPPAEKNSTGRDKKHLKLDQVWFLAGMGSGFAAALWGFCGMLLVKRSWANAYFGLLDNLLDWLFVTFLILATKLKRKIRL